MRFHAFQAIFLGLAGIIVAIALVILTTILGMIPVIGWVMDSLVWLAYGAVLLVVVILLMYKAYNGEQYSIPVIGDLAFQQAGK